MAEVTVGTNTHTYAYGASNQRLQMVEGSTTTLYAWEGGSVIAEYNGASNGMVWTKSYVYLGGRLLATDSTNGIQYHHPDRLGTRLVTNTSGGIVSENINLPFGNTINGESCNLAGGASKKRFTSYDRSVLAGLCGESALLGGAGAIHTGRSDLKFDLRIFCGRECVSVRDLSDQLRSDAQR